MRVDGCTIDRCAPTPWRTNRESMFLVRRSSAMNHFPATIPMLIVKTPTKTTIKIPAYSMASIDVVIAIIVFLLPENFFIRTHLK